MKPNPLPQSWAITPAFVETIDDGRWINANHIVAMVKIPSMEAWVATTASQHTFRLSSYIVEQLLRGAAKDRAPKVPQDAAS
jgi:hypothetical protein